MLENIAQDNDFEEFKYDERAEQATAEKLRFEADVSEI